ncbi:MAG TPA: menaquinone biosynthesis protein [Terriglobales bacterium]|nr:menaquinone biosynthesis protein [Terriglobales bacterium]
MARLRISAISYLNTAPLMWDFEHGSAGREFDISYTIPSLCAAALRDGTADIGIIPAAAYASIPDLVIIPVVAIAALDAVRSILILSKVPANEIRTLAADTSSMTSVALSRVLFSKWIGSRPEFVPMKPELGRMLEQCDAGLLIGDPALAVDRGKYPFTYDLAEEWHRHTALPFVFAFWAVRKEALRDYSGDLAGVFQDSRDHGLEHLDEIAREWSPRLALSESEVKSYLTKNIYFSLDPKCLEGMQQFFHYAAECGAIPIAPRLRFLQQAVRPDAVLPTGT